MAAGSSSLCSSLLHACHNSQVYASVPSMRPTSGSFLSFSASIASNKSSLGCRIGANKPADGAATVGAGPIATASRRRQLAGNATTAAGRRLCVAAAASTDSLGFLGRLGRVIKEKATSDFDRVFKGVRRTRENLAVVDELLTYWNLNDADSILEEMEEALIVADFGPRAAVRIVDAIRADVMAGKLKTGPEIRSELKREIVKLLTEKTPSTALNLPTKKPAVVMIVGVNGGGKTTTIGKLSHKFKKEGAKVLLAAGDTFRAAAGEQLEVWAERTEAEIVLPEGDKTRPATVLSSATRKAVEEDFDILLADTSGRLHTNFNLMEELKGCKKAITRVLPQAPHEVLLVLDGTTGLNMLPQAREFNEVVGVTGFILTKLDGTARGGCVASVVDELGIPVKFVGVGEGLDDLQPFDAPSFVDALFPS